MNKRLVGGHLSSQSKVTRGKPVWPKKEPVGWNEGMVLEAVDRLHTCLVWFDVLLDGHPAIVRLNKSQEIERIQQDLSRLYQDLSRFL